MNIIKRFKQKQRKVLYFAYGSNLSTLRMDERVYHYVKICNYKLLDYKLEFNAGKKDGYANVVPAPGEWVWGVLYQLSYKDLKRLDIYEGYPLYYDRVRIEDYKYDLPIYFYEATSNYRTLSSPRLEYLRWIEKGLMEHGLHFPFNWKKIEALAINKHRMLNE